MNKPEYIIIHHSATRDGAQNDWEAIRRYHKSWRYNGNIITEAEYTARVAAGKLKGLQTPWLDIGYHFGIELDGDKYLLKTGRPLTMDGAHCTEGGMNHRSIGICVVGNFDETEVPEPAFDLLVEAILPLMRSYAIPIGNLKRHTDYASYKSCPGTKFPWSRLLQTVGERL